MRKCETSSAAANKTNVRLSREACKHSELGTNTLEASTVDGGPARTGFSSIRACASFPERNWREDADFTEKLLTLIGGYLPAKNPGGLELAVFAHSERIN